MSDANSKDFIKCYNLLNCYERAKNGIRVVWMKDCEKYMIDEILLKIYNFFREFLKSVGIVK